MGWDFCDAWKTKKDVVDRLLRDYAVLNGSKMVDFKSTTHGLWSVFELDTGKRLIYFDLIEKQSGEWGYKSMSEAMGPYYYDCPERFLKMVTAENSDSVNHEWRCRYYAINDAKKEARKAVKMK